jgi:hypothetical protein
MMNYAAVGALLGSMLMMGCEAAMPPPAAAPAAPPADVGTTSLTSAQEQRPIYIRETMDERPWAITKPASGDPQPAAKPAPAKAE